MPDTITGNKFKQIEAFYSVQVVRNIFGGSSGIIPFLPAILKT